MTKSRKNAIESPHLIGKSVRLDENDINYVTTFEKECECPDSTLARIAVQLFINQVKDESTKGVISVKLREEKVKKGERIHHKVYLNGTQIEEIDRLKDDLYCNFGQIVRYAYHQLVVVMKKLELFK